MRGLFILMALVKGPCDMTIKTTHVSFHSLDWERLATRSIGRRAVESSVREVVKS